MQTHPCLPRDNPRLTAGHRVLHPLRPPICPSRIPILVASPVPMASPPWDQLTRRIRTKKVGRRSAASGAPPATCVIGIRHGASILPTGPACALISAMILLFLALTSPSTRHPQRVHGQDARKPHSYLCQYQGEQVPGKTAR